jgi:hypothetical protein
MGCGKISFFRPSAENVIDAKKKGEPQALKRRHILNDLTARLKSCPSRFVHIFELTARLKAARFQNRLEVEFFLNCRRSIPRRVKRVEQMVFLHKEEPF